MEQINSRTLASHEGDITGVHEMIRITLVLMGVVGLIGTAPTWAFTQAEVDKLEKSCFVAR